MWLLNKSKLYYKYNHELRTKKRHSDLEDNSNDIESNPDLFYVFHI